MIKKYFYRLPVTLRKITHMHTRKETKHALNLYHTYTDNQIVQFVQYVCSMHMFIHKYAHLCTSGS